MKRLFLIFLTWISLSLSAPAQAGSNVSLDFFYDNLGPEGNWIELAGYGYCWQPDVAVGNPYWRPYADGYWAFTDVGWTWVSYEDFGWATYHYGRWLRLRGRGWVWVPGRIWGPAWVSWRVGNDFVGWAPIPARVGYDGGFASPVGADVDIEFDIGPTYYAFVDIRYFGEPILRERILEPGMNVTYVTRTVNVTNITYVDSVVYNHGPNFDLLTRRSARPIRRMTLEHDQEIDLNSELRPSRFTTIQGDKLVVAAPRTIQKPQKSVIPKRVKEKIAQPTLERGWDSVSDEKVQAELKQKMKSENPKDIPLSSSKTRENPIAEATPPEPGSLPSLPRDRDLASPPLQKPKLAASPQVPPRPPLPRVRPTPFPGTTPAQPKPKAPPPPVEAIPRHDTLPEMKPRQPLPPVRTSPKPDVQSDSRPKPPLPPARITPGKDEIGPDTHSKQRSARESVPGIPQTRSTLPGRDVVPKVQPQRSPERLPPPQPPGKYEGPRKQQPSEKRIPASSPVPGT